jgi:hypothetical protein
VSDRLSEVPSFGVWRVVSLRQHLCDLCSRSVKLPTWFDLLADMARAPEDFGERNNFHDRNDAIGQNASGGCLLFDSTRAIALYFWLVISEGNGDQDYVEALPIPNSQSQALCTNVGLAYFEQRRFRNQLGNGVMSAAYLGNRKDKEFGDVDVRRTRGDPDDFLGNVLPDQRFEA